MWGLLFFLPPAVAGGLLAAWLERRLAAAMPVEVPGRTRRGPQVAAWLTWLLAWSAYAAGWTVFASVVTQTHGFWPHAGWATLLGLPALGVVALAWRRLAMPAWRRATWLAVAGAAALALLLNHLLTPVIHLDDLAGRILLFLYCLLPPLALGLAGTAWRLGRPGDSLGLAPSALIFVVVGAFLVLPFPPLPADSYNPVGALFVFWGAWAPAGMALAALAGRRARA